MLLYNIFVIIKIVKATAEIKYWLCVYLYLDLDLFLFDVFTCTNESKKSDCKLIYIFNFLVGFSSLFLSVKKNHIIVDGTGILNVPIPPFTVVVFCERGM